MNASLPAVLARALAPMAPPQSEVHRIVQGITQGLADTAVTPQERRALLDLLDAGARPRFSVTHCSQCGETFGPGDSGFSDCRDHARASELRAILDRHNDEYRTGLDDVDGRHSSDEYDSDVMRVMRGAL